MTTTSLLQPAATDQALPPSYAPGLHVLATFTAPAAALRNAAGNFRQDNHATGQAVY
ncbi:MAG: hypothetical protein ACRYFV_10035 [Janthinobacterium lividum]